MHALLINQCPLADKSTSLGTAGYVDGFASHTLGPGVLEPRRWRLPMSRSPRGVHLAWSEPGVELPHSGLGVFNQTLRQKVMTYDPVIWNRVANADPVVC